MLYVIYAIDGFAQSNDCEVRMDGLNQTYEGECKKGLAHGKGVASGELGTYKGVFKKGFPNENGILTYSNGIYYEGEWKLGDKHGEGKMVFDNDSTLVGYWVDDEYVGKYLYPYKVISTYGPINVKIRKVSDVTNNIEIIFIRQGVRSPKDIVSMLLQGDSGAQLSGQITGFQDVVYPFEGQIDLTVNNLTRTITSKVNVRYKIYEEGQWQVIIDY